MKLIPSLMSFFSKKKIYMDDNEATVIVNLHNEVKIKPVPTPSISTRSESSCFILGEYVEPNYIRQVISSPAIICLNADKKMPRVARSADKEMNYIDLRFFSGLFAFLIFRDQHGKQFLTIKRLDNYESNHSVLHLFAKRGRFGDGLKTAKIICGGEVVLNQGQIERWNLKSGGYSQNSEFDENNNPNIQESIASLWIPMQDKFTSIKENDGNLEEKYTPKGSFRYTSTLFKPYSDKTIETSFHQDDVTNQESQKTVLYENRRISVV